MTCECLLGATGAHEAGCPAYRHEGEGKCLEFVAYGKSQPQGSASAFYVESLGRAVVTSANPANKRWRRDVAYSALDAMRGTGLAPPIVPKGQEARLVVSFYLPRPKYLKNTRPPNLVKPDLDKLVRSICDALKGVGWHDDSQVTKIEAAKYYAEASGGKPRVEVRIISAGPVQV